MIPSELKTALSLPLVALIAAEAGILLAGLFWLLNERHSLRDRLCGLSSAKLTASPHDLTHLLLAMVFSFGGGALFQLLAAHVGKNWFPPAEDGALGLFHVVVGSCFQLGLLAGLAHVWFWHMRKQRPELVTTDARRPTASSNIQAITKGAVAFVILLPLVWSTSVAWQALLDLFGIKTEPQELVSLFVLTGDFKALGGMIVLAVFIAPVAEELLFRIGLFRWLRTRTPRVLALLLPAVAFAALHASLAVFLPLVLLAVGLALAYEHSGHPLTPICAHALFNLHTIILLLAGFPA